MEPPADASSPVAPATVLPSAASEGLGIDPPAEEPSTLEDLFHFYQTTVKLNYSIIQAGGTLPTEILFEIHAAFEHLTRPTVFDASQAKSIRMAYGHLKRSCLDVFKLLFNQAVDQYHELTKQDIHLIDNGEFRKSLLALFKEMKTEAASARANEGSNYLPEEELVEKSIKAFDLWLPVVNKCLRLEQDYYLNTKVEWAKSVSKAKSRRARLLEWGVAFLVGVVSSVVASFLWVTYVAH